MIHFNANAEGASGVALLHKNLFVPRSACLDGRWQQDEFGYVTSTVFVMDGDNYFARMARHKRWLRKSQRTTMRRLRFEANRRKG